MIGEKADSDVVDVDFAMMCVDTHRSGTYDAFGENEQMVVTDRDGVIRGDKL